MIPFVAVFLPLLVAYAGTLLWCVARWNSPNGYFEHCWLVPFVFVLVVCRRREQWRAQPAAADRRGLWLLVPALVVHLLGALLIVDSLSALTLVLAVPGAAWLALGRDRLRGLWPALWLVLFLVPLPIFVEGRLAFTLKEVAVSGGSWLANLFGAEVVRLGDMLQSRGSPRGLYVAAACSGLRSLFAMVTLAYCLAFFTGPRGWRRRTALLVLAAPLAIVANVVRIAVLCLGARWASVDFAESTGHTLANIAEWVALVLLLHGADRLLSLGAPAAMPLPVAGVARVDSTWPVRTAVCLWLAAAPLAWLSFVRPELAVGDRAARLPSTIAGYTLVPRDAAAEAKFQRDLPQFRELLGTDDFVWRYYRAGTGTGTGINLVALFHDHNWKSVHPPRICIEGSNMLIEQDDLVPVAALQDDAMISRIVARERTSGARFVTLSLFGTRGWMSGDYWAFAWHHLPLAWIRQNESGFLLRVESRIGKDERERDAEARCAAFLHDLVPLARGLLR